MHRLYISSCQDLLIWTNKRPHAQVQNQVRRCTKARAGASGARQSNGTKMKRDVNSPVPYRKLVNDTPELDFRTTVPTPPDIPAAFTESMVIPVFWPYFARNSSSFKNPPPVRTTTRPPCCGVHEPNTTTWISWQNDNVALSHLRVPWYEMRSASWSREEGPTASVISWNSPKDPKRAWRWNALEYHWARIHWQLGSM